MPSLPFLFDAMRWDDWKRALDDHGWRLLAIVAVLLAARFFFKRLIGRSFSVALSRAGRLGRDDPQAMRQRVDTLLSTVNWMFTIFLLLLGVTLVLDEIGVSVAALVAGVGLAGIALGLGAQALVKDVINGMFILLEDQYRVGDVVQVAGVDGLVVEITPRRTVLRDMDGNLHSVPNGAIGIATNMTRGLSRINLDLALAYEEDLARVIPAIDEVCAGLAAERPADFLSTPSVLRVSGFGADGVRLKVTGDVQPGKQWELTGELRRRLKDRFDREGVEVPYHREVQVPWEEVGRARARVEVPPPGRAGTS